MPLAGCVNLGASDFLVTPVVVVGVHSFAPQPNAIDGADEREADEREAAVHGAIAAFRAELHGGAPLQNEVDPRSAMVLTD